MLFIIFFFKQKTAYEMRISDWSSDVCSSDLPAPRRRAAPARWPHNAASAASGTSRTDRARRRAGRSTRRRPARRAAAARSSARGGERFRSEEHTSELQSLMRNSYAVFCLKKKNKNKQHLHEQKKQKQTTGT